MADSPDLPPLPSDPAPAAPRSAPLPAPKSRPWAGLHALWTVVVRLIILGAGVSLGWLVGMLVAQAMPSRNPDPPLTEVILRQGSQTGRKLRQLPSWWQSDGPVDGVVDEVAPAPEASPSEASGVTAAPEASPPVPEAERDRIQTDLTALRQDLAGLNARLSELETSLGATPTGTLEDRLQRLDQRLGAETVPRGAPQASAAKTPAPEPPPEAGTDETAPAARVPYQEPRFPLVRDRVVLPSALLFAPGSSILTPSGQQLLDSIASDLRRYGAATLLVGSHTDGASSPDLASQLTLQQAVAVQQYLSPQLEGSGIRWVPVGYGQTRPTAVGTTPADQQRNQRVEIGIVPGN
ncbi:MULTISPECIES: OmpA family protein [Cyanophyceae]|uniref:OmpA family protein n=1 Tax=Cyanophyceae TaxID=3028117 RepID=UPI001688EE5C|nr:MULTISPECIES: OmpA family protein [Cyanophyceae]MBD1917781.1 OmpA family protein [Phormidium sp. FACHB-77]MBD2032899.1 OmpA family protein [Phormidium sp. FACHB-322]MBD2051647.1 OmpA family protein [Leptolyngbya sp. FACHB-60]